MLTMPTDWPASRASEHDLDLSLFITNGGGWIAVARGAGRGLGTPMVAPGPRRSDPRHPPC